MERLLDILGFFGVRDVLLYIANYVERQDPSLARDLSALVKKSAKESQRGIIFIDPVKDDYFRAA